MHKDSMEALDFAHTHVEHVDQFSRTAMTDPKWTTVESIRELTNVVYQVGRAIVIQLAAGPDK